MSNFLGNLYSGVLDHQDHFTQWALSAMVERLPMSQARWSVISASGIRELAVAGSASQPRTGEFATLRIEVLEELVTDGGTLPLGSRMNHGGVRQARSHWDHE